MLNCDAAHRFNDLFTLIHELGHRYWYKIMASGQRDTYEDMFLGEVPALTVDDRERFWKAWKNGGYTLRGAKRHLKPDQYDLLKMYLDDHRGVNLVPNEKLGYTEDVVHRHFVRPKLRLYSFDKQRPGSVTQYGSTSVEEDFAEVFAHHVTDRALTPDAEKRFRMVI
jgi:hypothetical protein